MHSAYLDEFSCEALYDMFNGRVDDIEEQLMTYLNRMSVGVDVNLE